MTVKLKISRGRLKLRDIIAAERGFSGRSEDMAKFLARFVVDDDGNYLSHDDALDKILDLDMTEIPQVTAQLAAEIRRTQSEAVPLVTETP